MVSQYLGALRKKETDDSDGQLILLSLLLGLGLVKVSIEEVEIARQKIVNDDF